MSYEIRLYEHEQWGFTFDELDNLGHKISTEHLHHLRRFASKALSQGLGPHFYTARGIRFYKSEIRKTVVAFSAEERVGDIRLKLMVMFAGRIGVPFVCGPPHQRAHWDGVDLADLFQGVVYERARAMFF